MKKEIILTNIHSCTNHRFKADVLEQCHHKSTGMYEHSSLAKQFMGTSLAIVMTQCRGVCKPQCIAIVLSTLISCIFNKLLKKYCQLSVMCTTCTTKKQRQSMKSKISVAKIRAKGQI